MTPKELLDKLLKAKRDYDARFEYREPTEALDIHNLNNAFALHLKRGNSAVIGNKVVTCDSQERVIVTDLVEMG